jgi:hypothetical protein
MSACFAGRSGQNLPIFPKIFLSRNRKNVAGVVFQPVQIEFFPFKVAA